MSPENSKYLSLELFANIDVLLSRCREINYVLFIGGDFNVRLGDLNNLSTKSGIYENNCDKTANKHERTYMTDICRRNKVSPVNHLKYKGQTFNGTFTYFKSKRLMVLLLISKAIRNHKSIMFLQTIARQKLY